MADDWKPGDLALCVNNSTMGGLNPHGRELTVGRAYRVLAVTPPGDWACENDGVGLVIDGPRNSGPDGDWHECRFRKINPLTDEEREDALRELNPPVPHNQGETA